MRSPCRVCSSGSFAQRSMDVLAAASSRQMPISVSVAVVAEWWRGSRRQAQILKLVSTEAMTESIAKSAGEAIAAQPGATVVDVIVMASAAARGGVVYTSDFDDLVRLRGHFREVRVLSV